MTFLRRLWDSLFATASNADAQLPDQADAGTLTQDSNPSGAAQSGQPVRVPLWWVPETCAVQDCEATDDSSDEPDSDYLDATLHQALEFALQDGALELPRLPHVTDRALLMLRGDNANYRDLSKVVSEDPAITAQILRVANSAAYGGVTEIRSLENAFARLGQRTVRSVILSASMRQLSIRIGGAKRTLGEKIWRRTMAAGVIMSAAAKRCRIDENDAFVAGLMHDIGQFVVLMVAHETTRKMGVKLPSAAFERISVQWHEAAGLRLAESWQLPAPLPALIADHHRLPATDDPHEKLRLLIMFADVVSSMLRYAPFHPYDFFATPCVERLGFTDTPETHEFLLSLPVTIEDRIEYS